MTAPLRLLAKSSRTADDPRYAETLPGHAQQVAHVAAMLVEANGARYLAAMDLDPAYLPVLTQLLTRAAIAHDFGKANDYFQRMVRFDRSLGRQAGWHEHLSVGMLLSVPALADWLFTGVSERDRFMLLIAVLGHHLRAESGEQITLQPAGGSTHLTVFLGHPDFSATLRTGARIVELPEPPVLSDLTIDLIDGESFDIPMRRWLRRALAWWESAPEPERRFTALLKALIIATDVAGSALPRLHRSGPNQLDQWLTHSLTATCAAADVRRVVVARLGDHATRPFQQLVAASTHRVTYVRAGCGTGKTAAAYLWAERHAAGRKLFVCYPTTGTASQGYTDYVPPDQFESALVHSRAMADLEDLLLNGEEPQSERFDQLVRWQALVTWTVPITVCTVDSVLGIMQNNRTGLFSTPAIATGAFVFDEIHQYDDALFDALLAFLRAFRGVPILLMTASLPEPREGALAAAVAETGDPLDIIDGPRDLEELKRYRLVASDEEEAWATVTRAINAGQRVLWVVNTVSRAIALAHAAAARGIRSLVYHSRYRYGDRLSRHREVVSAFTRSEARGAFAITTQVCEVSLDLDANVLITELAPVPALIQRLGRLNRRSTPDHPRDPAPAFVIEPARPEPYEDEELRQARVWIDRLGKGPLSQRDLAQAFSVSGEESKRPANQIPSAWLDGGVFARRAPLREAGTTIPVVRAEDLADVDGASPIAARTALIRNTIPMPIRPIQAEWSAWRDNHGVIVAPPGRLRYDTLLGGEWV